MRKLTMLVSGAVGYVLGTRAGRERYEQIKSMATRVKEDPRVQDKAQQATELAKEKAPVVKDKVSGAADAARAKVSSDGSGDGSSTEAFPDESMLNQEEPYPKGDLP